MILFPLMECCQLLTVDPKTLRRWLEQATMQLHVHPHDSRRKCLTHEQLQHLSLLHDRTLTAHPAFPLASLVTTPLLSSPEEPSHPLTSTNVEQGKTTMSAALEEKHLRQKLSQLEAQVILQQHQLLLLTQDLLRERATRTEPRRLPLEIQALPQGEPVQLENQDASFQPLAPRSLHPAEQRARFLVLPPLIEYSTAGTYVVISSQEGEIPLVPDTLEWFEWFRTLSSFRFVGKEGCFGACRGYNRRPTRLWHAHRTIHQHQYGRYLGLSEHLTIAHLEAMAATLQAYV
jgi:hypothetical protein